MISALPSLDQEPTPWRAALEVRLGLRAGRTRILDASHVGPLRLQRVFHPEQDGTAHLVVLHPPAGLVGGDALSVQVQLDDGQALVTTTGAGKAYRSAAREASACAELDVRAGSCLEYVPQETVVFDGAYARLATRVRLTGDAAFLGWEVVCLGRPACQERFERGRVSISLEVEHDGALVFVERGRIAGGGDALDARWGLAGHAAFGTMIATHGEESSLREALAPWAALGTVGVTRVGRLTVVRAMGADGLRVRSLLERARHVVRDAWCRPRVDPAIWRS